MYDIIHVEQGSEEWHELRSKYYKTASRTPSVMMVNPFMSIEQLAMNLRGEYEPFYSNAMRQGNELEDMVREKANELLNDAFMPCVAVSGGFLASLDGINFDRDTIIEIKVSEKTFNQVKDNVISDNYFFQIMHQMMVFDTVEKSYLVAYNPKTEEIAISKPILKDTTRENQIIKAWQEFDKVKDTLIVKEFDMSDNEYFMEKVSKFKEIESSYKTTLDIYNQAKEELYSMYKGGKTFGGGVTISYAKDSETTDYKSIFEDNKDLLKKVDIKKYKKPKKGGYRVTSK